MAKLTKIPKFSFLAGELSPLYTGDAESDDYHRGMSKLENWMVDISDGIKNCPGLQYIDTAYVSTDQSRLIPFEFNEEQAYVIELGDSIMRVIKDGALVLRSIRNATYKWTESVATPGEYHLELAAGGDPGLLQPKQMFEDGVGMLVSNPGFLVESGFGYGDNDGLGYSTPYARITGTTDPDLEATDYLEIPFLITSPYPIADVDALEYTQSADTIYLFHEAYNIRKITRTADNAWTITEVPDMDGPYQVRVVGDEDIRINVDLSLGPGNPWEITANSAIFGDVKAGDCIRLGFPIPGAPESIHWSWFIVSTWTSSTVILANHEGDTANASPIVYQQITDPEFKKGTVAWEEQSDANSTLGYDYVNESAILTDGAAGDARMQQAILTQPNVRQTIGVVVQSKTGATPKVNLKVGTTSLAKDLLDEVDIGTGAWTFMPTQETVYVSLDTNGSTDTDVIKISSVEVYTAGEDPFSAPEYNTTDWRLGEFNATHGYPKYGIISNQRMILANIPTKPQTIWASELANFEGYGESTPSRSSDGFSFFPATKEINGIRWIIDKGGLKVGTADAVWRIFAPSGGVIAPLDVAVDVDEAEGSLPLKPIVAHNAIIMTPRGKTPVLEMVSSLEAQGFATRDLASRAGHLFENRRIVRWAFAKDPDSVIWCVLDDGSLVGLTYHRRLDVWGWFTRTCPLGEGYVDVVVVPNSNDDNTDDVYFVVNRGGFLTGPGSYPDNFFIERINRRITPQTAAYGLSASGTAYDYKLLDSAVTLDNPKTITAATQADPVVITSAAHGFSNGDLIRIQNVEGMTDLNNVVYKVASSAANSYELTDEDDNDIDGTGFGEYKTGGEAREMVLTVTGLEHLNGQTITVIADGAAREGLVVSSGSVTLPQKASFAHAGIPYTATAEGMDIENSISTQGLKKSFSAVDVYFVDSRHCSVYASTAPAKTKPIQFEDEAFGENPPPLFTGIKNVGIKSDSDKQVRLGFVQAEPYPVHIRRAIIHVDFEG